MKLSEVKTQGESILKTVYKYVLISDDKAVWKSALESIEKRIYQLSLHKHASIIENREDANEYIVKVWVWESAKRQMLKRFSKRFL